MANIISAWVNSGGKVEDVFRGKRSTKQHVPPYTNLLCCALIQEHALAHSIMYIRLVKAR